MFCIFDPACELNCCPHGWRNYTCVLSPLYCTFSLTSSPLPPFPMYSIYQVSTDSVWLGGGGVLKCTVDHILQFYTLFLTRFRTYKIASPTQTKMTSKDDIKGLVSLKFLRSWWSRTHSLITSHGRNCWNCSLKQSESRIYSLADQREEPAQ